MGEQIPTVLGFDVFGTVVDWHGTISREIRDLVPGIDGDAFATAWRAGYVPAMQQVLESGEWRILDDLHRDILDAIVPAFSLDLDEQQLVHLNEVWHRLDPWPDSVDGITRLKSRFVVVPLSNGNLRLLTMMAKRAGIPWDAIMSTEVFRSYKPDPSTYLGLARTFAVRPDQTMLVAAHHTDLDAAQNAGLLTAYIERPWETGRRTPKDVSPSPRHPLHVRDIAALADHFGC